MRRSLAKALVRDEDHCVRRKEYEMKLARIAGAAALTLLLVAYGCEKKQKAAEPVPEEPAAAAPEGVIVTTAKEEMTMYYTCPMESHKHVHSKDPGNCPECGMQMVQVVQTTEENAEYYGCPMPEHSHVRQDGPGTCEECGMKLVPMKLEKT